MSAALSTVLPILLTVPTAIAHSHQVSVPIGFELVPVVVASVSGVLTAREEKLDLVGAVFLAVAVALGGGLLRDMILQVGDVYILNQPIALPVSLVTAVVVFVLPSPFERFDRLISVLDIFSVGLFAVMGADKAMTFGFDPPICIMMGFFTAVGGGLIRDICLGKVPNLFRPGNLYGLTAIAGALAYVLLVEWFDVWNMAAMVACVALTMLLRWISLRYDIKSPTEIDLKPLARPMRRVAETGKAPRNVARARKRGQRRDDGR